MTEQEGLITEDYVAVESGNHTKLRRVSLVYCQTSTVDSDIEKALHKEIQEDASECHQAKEELLKTSQKEPGAAMRKMKALCDD